MLALLAHERQHLAAGPEMRSVLAQVPALVSAMSGCACAAHLRFRDAVPNVALGEEDAGRSAEHLTLAPTERAPCAFVPTGNVAVPVHSNDSVVGCACQDLVLKLLLLTLAAPRAPQFQLRHNL